MVSIKVNGITFLVNKNFSILEACKFLGVKIPRFCYHESLPTVGNCRMCLIRIEDSDDDKDDKLFSSCTTPVLADASIIIDDPFIRKAREDVIRFLLLDHPLDCPICDQGGECDLQDQAIRYGNNETTYNFKKLSVNDKNVNSFIKTIMTRCIHCTRCIRFSSEIAGVDFFGALSRGNSTEIGVYVPTFFKSEISGNVIDLCPVGALTSKPYAFKFRPWELRSVESIDLTDSIGSNIYVNFSETQVHRILPKYNFEINENIISDKSRFSYDSFYSSQSLKSEINKNKFDPITQKVNTVKQIAYKHHIQKKILVLLNDELSLESYNVFNILSKKYSNLVVRSLEFKTHLKKKNIFFKPLNLINSIYDSFANCFLIAVNPRTEAIIINTKIRLFTNFRKYTNIYNMGYKYDSNLDIFFVNFNILELLNMMEGKAFYLAKNLIEEFNPLFVTGTSLLQRGLNLKSIETFLKEKNPSFNFLNTYLHSNSLGALFYNLKPLSSKELLNSELLFFVNSKENVFLRKNIFFKKSFISINWLNTHACDILNQNNHIQLLTKNIFEDNGTYINLEFRPQKTQAIFINKSSLSVKHFFIRIFESPIYSSKKHNEFLREILFYVNKFQYINKHTYINLTQKKDFFYTFTKKISLYPFKPQFNDFYVTNFFTTYSKNMVSASRELRSYSLNFDCL